MKITSLSIYHFHIPFTAPMRVDKQVLDVREGFILELRTDNGFTSYGEISPLPGLDNVSIDQCQSDFSSLPDFLTGSVLHFDHFSLTRPFLGIVSLPEGKELREWTNHTWFGVECALMGLLLQQNCIKVSFPLRIPVNGLFIPDKAAQNVNDQINKLKDQGIQTVKVKIGRMAADEEISQIRELSNLLGMGISFRLDGNRNLMTELYRYYYDALRDLNVEYAEEPLPDGNLEKALAVPWPVALDESLDGILDSSEPRPSLIHPMLKTIILKPGLLAGLHAMARCIADARCMQIKTVLSSSFNTGVTLASLGIFSRLADIPPETAHGLDTLRYLEGDVLITSLDIMDGKLVIPKSFTCGEQILNSSVFRKEEGL
ncbi:MAG: enolase C-terminal domain-like protein [Smithella sp.]